ncbi:MAG: DUF4190 domain-containing protein [Clostridia bacterium]|nr:DUF4190 domain-containing protein [Clostridia bacterium]
MSKTCKYCGNRLEDGDNFCQKCGAVADSVENQPRATTQDNVTTNNTNNTNYTQPNTTNNSEYAGKTSGIAIGGFVCSIIGFFILGIPLGIVSISLGAAALIHIKTFPKEKGTGLAITALVMGIIDIVGAILVNVFNLI